MPVPMSPTDSMFLSIESRDQPMHVAGLQLFVPPDGATAGDVRDQLISTASAAVVDPLFRRRPRRSVTSFGQWAWEQDDEFDLEHHVRTSALPAPGRVRELLALCSRLHGTLLDRQYPLWQAHVIEGLADGRLALYFKVHHALLDGVSAARLVARSLTTDPDEREMLPPWSRTLTSRPPRPPAPAAETATTSAGGGRFGALATALGIVPAVASGIADALREQTTTMSFSAPHSMFNVPVSSVRRFAAQSWPLERILAVGRATGSTVNDVVLAMCAGTLRTYLLEHDALPDTPLIAAVPVSLREADSDATGNAVGMVMCNLATTAPTAAERLELICASMSQGKRSIQDRTPLQILAMSGLGIAPLALLPALGLVSRVRPPFNIIISNVPGPRAVHYFNGARLDGTYPLSIPLAGQALNITVTSYHDQLSFGLVACRRTVPHLQRMLTYLDAELEALEAAVRAA